MKGKGKTKQSVQDPQLALFKNEKNCPGKDAIRRIKGEITFEPLMGGIRVAARDGESKVLWGFIGSKEMLNSFHCPVAIYETLRHIVGEELEKHGLPAPSFPEDLVAAREGINNLRGILDGLEKSIRVKKESKATKARARAITHTLADIKRQIHLELPVPSDEKTGSEQE